MGLAIPTKITKGTIEIIKDVDIIKAGDRVGMSEATLLNMLKISPFSYGLVISKVYDSGSVFDPEILDITDADLLAKFASGVANVAAMSFLADPSAFAAAAPAAAAAAAPAAAAAAAPP